ncbi:MAG: CDP-diacylglycerol--glycerol-3-phosphate 3-phosphatidyltransferase, partial [Candidatus Aminicenantes bacterium]|nr:CDP-diacylglycerol--glycerol-3-phosphate 3-phosphatidyltransferase [Candidatus Aminicenantes bacterium]
NEIETWAAAVIILREIFMTAFRLYFFMKEASFSASKIAKNKTLFQIIAVSIFIIYKKLPYPEYLHKIGTIVLYIAVFLTVYSAIEYIIKYSKSLKKL